MWKHVDQRWTSVQNVQISRCRRHAPAEAVDSNQQRGSYCAHDQMMDKKVWERNTLWTSRSRLVHRSPQLTISSLSGGGLAHIDSEDGLP